LKFSPLRRGKINKPLKRSRAVSFPEEEFVNIVRYKSLGTSDRRIAITAP